MVSWTPLINLGRRDVTKTQDEPWQEVMENIGRMTQKKFSLERGRQMATGSAMNSASELLNDILTAH